MDLESISDNSIDIALIDGGIRFSDHEEMIKLLRRKSRLIIAFGTCAYLGGIPGLSNLYKIHDILNYVYKEIPTVMSIGGSITTSGNDIELPRILMRLKPIDSIVEVDYYIPGCPPTTNIIKIAFDVIFNKKLLLKGTVFGSNRSLCDECPLNRSKPENIVLKEIKRPHLVKFELDKCLLAQGIICLGPVTRGGCGALCIKGGMPCTGCFGPLDNVRDFGARALSYIASILNYSNEEEARKAINSYFLDVVGMFYRYSLPKSLIRGRRFGDGE